VDEDDDGIVFASEARRARESAQSNQQRKRKAETKMGFWAATARQKGGASGRRMEQAAEG
jgi:hypothetical protein